MLFTFAFWKGAGERALKTFAQSLVAVLGVSGLTLGTVQWGVAFGTAGLAAVLSVLTSVGSADTVAAPFEPVEEPVDPPAKP